MKRIFRKICLRLFAVLLFSTSLAAQNSNSFQLATRLMQQQEYAEALPLLEELNQDHPNTFAYAARLIDCLIQLKQYDQGLKVTEQYEQHPEFKTQIKIKIGELYHFKGQKDKAFDVWMTNLEENRGQSQLYLHTARTMVNRQEYMEAVKVYKKARTTFQNSRLFFGDIANAYMRAGEYELAIDEWLSLLEESPNQISFIQRSLLRFDDPLLNDITIVELNERLDNISITDQSYEAFYKLQIWLLQENKLYRRALAAAKEYENRSNSYNYSLFNLGRRLVENNQFELAEEAFTYYTDRTYGEIKWRALEELSKVYANWAKYIDDYSLNIISKRDSLYHLSSAMLDSIEAETNNYSEIKNVQLKRVELALDHIFDLQKAQNALLKLKKIPDTQNTPEFAYLEGRIHLAQKEFTQARIKFTRANKQAEIGELAEKTRYFLALTDFYSGDFEFATIQLKSLGRNNTSYYANDALELRLWLQQGLANDSSGVQLSRFADAVFKENNGQSEESADLFLTMISDPDFNSLKDDALLFLARSAHINQIVKLTQLSAYLAERNNTPIREKLLWEQATLAERTDLTKLTNDCKIPEECVFYDSKDASLSSPVISPREIYEELIMSFPQGFYAPYARERLSNLPNQNS